MIWLGLALAHDLAPGAIAVEEIRPQHYAVQVTAPRDGGSPVDMSLRWPEGCVSGPSLRCSGGLAGRLEVPALEHRRVKVVLSITHLDGHQDLAVLREGEHAVELGPDGIHPPTPTAWALLGLGAEHVLSGLDHLFVVLALTLIARRWTLVGAITGFTVGHSLSLAASALGGLAVPMAATELLIAASVLLLAREILRPAWTSQAPVVVSGLIGLVHGLGLAAGFTTLGLAPEARAMGLLLFNLGIELGQLLVVVLALLALALLPPKRRLAAYVLGLPAGVWTVERAWIWVNSL